MIFEFKCCGKRGYGMRVGWLDFSDDNVMKE